MTSQPDRRPQPPSGRVEESGHPDDGEASRRLAITALARIDETGAYANLLLPSLLDRSGLAPRDRRFVTELVYGTTRMSRACDWLVDRFLLRDRLDPPIRAALRLGAYQLAFLGVPPHAAVSATVAATRGPGRKTVNAVLRRLADDLRGSDEIAWPDLATRLSYPDWIVDRLIDDLGAVDAEAALSVMNHPAPVERRSDGYVQDLSSQWVADLVEARPEHRVVDLCAGPGGKATAVGATGAHVVATDQRFRRARLVRTNGEKVGTARLSVLAADGTRPPFRPASVDRVLVDAPCTGLGALRRRPDARWRIDQAGLDRLVEIQRQLVDAAVDLLAPGGLLIYSVCTLTDVELLAVDNHLAAEHPHLEEVAPPADPWRPLGRGARLLPGPGTDGMALLRVRRPS